MRIIWTPEAADNLESIYIYLSGTYPALTSSTIRTLYDAVRTLRSMPGRGRPGLVAGTLEFVLLRLPYIIVYRRYEDAIQTM